MAGRKTTTPRNFKIGQADQHEAISSRPLFTVDTDTSKFRVASQKSSDRTKIRILTAGYAAPSNSANRLRSHKPKLKLTKDVDARDLDRNFESQTASSKSMGQAITGPTDPRWVLAVRVSENLEGAVLQPKKRERLVRLGKVLGLTPFDANLVIAIVQDQARRGFSPQACLTAGEPQLRLVPLGDPNRKSLTAKKRKVMIIAFVIAGLLAVEMLVMQLFLA